MSSLSLIRVFAFSALSLCALAPAAHAYDWQSPSTQSDSQGFFDKVSDTSKWDAKLGVGVGFAPSYEGSDRFDLVALPMIDLSYDNRFLYANTRGLGISPLRGQDYHVSVGLGYDLGRYESDDRKNLRGLNKVDASLLGTLSADYTYSFLIAGADFKSALFGDYGTTFGVRTGARYALSPNVTLDGDVHTTWADREHMRNFFGVKPKAALASGKSYFNPDSGFKNVGLSLGAKYAFSKSWSLRGTFTTDMLIGDADKSPVSVESLQPSGLMSVGYTF